MARTYQQFWESLTDEQREQWARAGEIWNQRYEPHMYTCCSCLARVDRRDPHPCICKCEGTARPAAQEGRDGE